LVDVGLQNRPEAAGLPICKTGKFWARRALIPPHSPAENRRTTGLSEMKAEYRRGLRPNWPLTAEPRNSKSIVRHSSKSFRWTIATKRPQSGHRR